MEATSSSLISIGMPVYNAGHLLREAVESILNQTYNNWELLIIDDGSNDLAVEHLRESGLLNDSRISVFSDGKNRGLAARLNECIAKSSGKFFARMDQDDISLPYRLERQITYLSEHPDIDLLSTRVNTINCKGEIIGALPYHLNHNELCEKPWQGFYMPHPTWMGRVSWFKKHLYAQPGPYLCEDQELLLRTYTNSKFACMDEVLLNYRVRNFTPPNRLLKTYISVFKVQYNYFIKNKKIFVFHAVAILFSRVLKLPLIALKQKIS